MSKSKFVAVVKSVNSSGYDSFLQKKKKNCSKTCNGCTSSTKRL